MGISDQLAFLFGKGLLRGVLKTLRIVTEKDSRARISCNSTRGSFKSRTGMKCVKR